MVEMPPKLRIVLVTPVWNDSRRLALFGQALAEALVTANLPIRWIIADDGSDADEASHYTRLCEQFQALYPHVKLVRCGVRSRKGGAVYDAWNQSDGAEYYAFVDADGAVSPETMIELIHRARAFAGERAVIAMRSLRGPHAVQRSWLRRWIFLFFRRMVRWLTGLRFEDTQCGAKVIPGEAYREVAGKLPERGFTFDAELLLALQTAGVSFEEIPISWREVPGSRIRPLPDGVQMVRALCRIRQRSKAGFYASR
jgi:glycosyltransferase involved in cell wall biosynthesis